MEENFHFQNVNKKAKHQRCHRKQEAHGPHRSPENQLQSINKFVHDKFRPQC